MNTNQTITSAPQSNTTFNSIDNLQNPLSLNSSSVQQPNMSSNNNTIFQSNSNTTQPNTSQVTNNSSGFFSFFSSTTFKIIVVLILLAILGVNILRYLANTTDFIANNFSKGFIKFLTQSGILITDTTKTITRKTKKGIKTTAKVVDQAVSNKKRDTIINNNHNNNNDNPEPNTSTGKWCFIGNDRGYGSCKKVDDGSRCMSGLLYPTQEECRNKH